MILFFFFITFLKLSLKWAMLSFIFFSLRETKFLWALPTYWMEMSTCSRRHLHEEEDGTMR